nr:cAMP-dependent protein kinase inhibitor gamma isoform X2 [Columba livia]
MAKKEPEQPHAPKCHSCPAQINRTHSDRQALCSHCKDRLGAEENSKEGSSILQTYRDAMEVESSTYTDFISSDRAGRRNAVYDIQQEATTISMRKLTGDIGNLSVEGPETQGDAASSENNPGASPNEQEDSPSP